MSKNWEKPSKISKNRQKSRKTLKKHSKIITTGKNRHKCQKTWKKPSKYRKIVKNVEKR